MGEFAAQHEGPDAMPACGICLGEAGRLSRVLNRHFTPVTHDLLPAVAALSSSKKVELKTRPSSDS